MAEKVLSNIVEGIMNSLNGPLVAIDGLENLRSTVSALKPVLLRAEEQLAPNHEVDRWLEKLNDVIYDTDDLLDAASTEALRNGLMTQDRWAKKVRTFFFKTYQFPLGRIMGKKIKAIGEQLDAITANLQCYVPLNPRDNRNYRSELSNLERFQDAKIIGREDDKKAVINDLLDSNVEENVSFLPIVGKSGLGKTTLAQLIYHDEVITRSFDLKMWVSVGDSFDIRITVKKLLESASRKIGQNSKLDGLKGEFENVIAGRKYFLVLDNLCNEDSEKWCELQNLLMNGARGSRVLITTRSENVAKHVLHPGKPHYLRGLTDEDSWHLFLDLTLPAGGNLENQGILEMARKIVQRCAGIPLITRTLASSFLYFRNSEAGCCDFMEKLLKSWQDEHDVLPLSLRLSYNMLPSHLKCCFAYCSLFPKGYTICKVTLIRLWIAQGFVKSQENLCLKDVGHEYFMDLLRDQFFNEPNFDEFGNITSCKMHEPMHELATSMARPLITMLEEKKINKKTRHVGFINFPPAMPSTMYKVRSIRTFLCSNFFNFEGECDCETIFSSFKLLRVLDLNYRDLTHVPSSISKLKHLRYLDLSYNKEIVKLPKSITSLLNLQTIRLSGCWSLKELPRDIKRLVKLRHLELDDCWELRYMPHGLGQLTDLQTLTLFVVDSVSLSKHCAGFNELNKLNKLRGRLVVRDSHAKSVVSKHRAANLREKLTSLDMRWCARSDLHNCDDNKSLECFQPKPNVKQLLVEECWDLRFSSWLLSLTNLVELKLLRCKKCQCLPPLSQLHSLKCLWLELMDAMQYISECSDQNEFFSSSSTPGEIFPALETIHLSNCPKLMGWLRDSSIEESGGSHILEHHLLPFFPSLSSLHISKCPHLIFMPRFPSLEELYLEDANWEPFLQTMTTGASSFAPLSKTRTMTLVSMMDVKTMLEDWLPKLTCLWTLSLKHCDDLRSLWVNHCDELKSLTVEHCDKLTFLTVEHCDELTSLTVEHCDILFCLVVRHLTALDKLVISTCYTLRSLGIRNCEHLTAMREGYSFQILKIVRCPKLTSLPGPMPWVNYLYIEECPTLKERYKEVEGEDWPKIKHIPQDYRIIRTWSRL